MYYETVQRLFILTQGAFKPLDIRAPHRRSTFVGIRDEHHVVGLLSEPVDERAIYLQVAYREALEVRERGVTCAEAVCGEPNAQGFEIPEPGARTQALTYLDEQLVPDLVS